MKKSVKKYLFIAAAVQFSSLLYVGHCAAEEAGNGMDSIQQRCVKYYTDNKAIKKCNREERRAAMDIYDFVEDLKDEGKPMRQSASSKEFSEQAVQHGKYFSACAILFELHKDQMACYHDGIEKYQERMKRRLEGKDPFSASSAESAD